jgi:hypothetical protein
MFILICARNKKSRNRAGLKTQGSNRQHLQPIAFVVNSKPLSLHSPDVTASLCTTKIKVVSYL